jgi:hypothetical protein
MIMVRGEHPTSVEHPHVADGNGKDAAIDPRQFNLWEATYSVKETIKALNDCRTGIYQLVADGQLHPVKRGRRTIFLARELAAYLKRLQAKPVVLNKSPRKARPRKTPPQTKAEA